MATNQIASEKQYFSCAETATLIRAALAKHFPGTKFSVRSKTYSGGASINVNWTDGPTAGEVDRVAGFFAGSTFDGMTDCKNYHESIFEGRRVHFGADHVFTQRRTSVELVRRAIRYANAKYGWQVREEQASEGSFDTILTDLNVSAFGHGHETKGDMIRRIAATMRPNGMIVTMKWGA